MKGRPVRLIQHHKQSQDTPRVSGHFMADSRALDKRYYWMIIRDNFC